jgi:hypothetical protein
VNASEVSMDFFLGAELDEAYREFKELVGEFSDELGIR